MPPHQQREEKECILLVAHLTESFPLEHEIELTMEFIHLWTFPSSGRPLLVGHIYSSSYAVSTLPPKLLQTVDTDGEQPGRLRPGNT